MKVFKSLLTAAVASAMVLSASAANLGLNGSGNGGFDLGGGKFASVIGLQDTVSNNLVGEFVTSADLYSLVISGNVLGFHYAAGNPASAFFENINLYAEFVSDTVFEGPGYDGRVFDSLYMVHTGVVVLDNGTGGTNSVNASNHGNYITGKDPFSRPVPDTGATLAMFGLGLAGLIGARKRFSK